VSTGPERMPERVPEELVDAFFDRALDEGSREKFFGMLRADLSRCAEVAKTQRMISILREPVEAPDLSDRIMARVAGQRGFLSARVRRMVTTGRLAAAAFVLVAVLGLAVVRRVSPDAFRLIAEARPLSDVIESGKTDAASGVMATVVSIQTAREPVARPTVRGVMGALSPGRITVRTLAHGGGALSMPLGAGTEERFVFVDGVCIDRRTAASVAVGSWSPPVGDAPCPQMLEQFIFAMVQSASLKSPGPSAAGPVP